MRLVVYVRVSTGKQVEEGLGLADQEQACRAWARQHGHTISNRGRIPASIQQAFDQAHQNG